MASVLDGFGRPAVYYPSSDGLYQDSQTGGQRKARPMLDRDFSSLVSRSKFRAMISDARWIWHSFPPVKAASTQKRNYVASSTFFPRFVGADQAWGTRAEAALKPLLKRSTNKGHSFTKSWAMACTALDTDGGIFPLRYLDRRGYPLTQFIEAHRVGSRMGESTVREGRYEGARLVNGIVYADDGSEIGYRVLGPTADADTIVSAQSMSHAADWTFSSENRPFPAVAYGILDFYDAKETRENFRIANKIHAALAIVETNETGRRVDLNPNATASANTSEGGLTTELYESGMIRYIRSKTGKIEAHKSEIPAVETQEFDRTVLSGAMVGMGWALEMLDLSRLRGAGYRGFADIINMAILDRHAIISHYAYSDLLYKLSAFIARGDIPENTEWMAWSFPQPHRFDVDRGNTQKLEEANARMGRVSIPQLIERDGGDPDEVLIKQARWEQKKRRIAAQYDVDPSNLGTLKRPGDLLEEKQDDGEKDDGEKDDGG